MDRDDFILIGSSLQEGESKRDVCPRCRGGTSGELSLSITRQEGEILWQCFRASCSACGRTGAKSAAPTTTKEKRPVKRWEGRLFEIPSKVDKLIDSLWGLVDVHDWYWTTDFGGRVAMSVRSPLNTHRGWVLRTVTDTARTKALTYMEQGEAMSWYMGPVGTGCVLVEDIPSALRASRYVNSVALLGTSVGLGRAVEIAEHALRPIYIALDQDATGTAMKLQKEYSLLWDNPQVILLKQDIKNMEEEAICDIFG